MTGMPGMAETCGLLGIFIMTGMSGMPGITARTGMPRTSR